MRARPRSLHRAPRLRSALMIEQAHGLTDSALEAIAGLERRVLAADGGRLKLEWGALRSRPDRRGPRPAVVGGRAAARLPRDLRLPRPARSRSPGWSIPDARRRGIGTRAVRRGAAALSQRGRSRAPAAGRAAHSPRPAPSFARSLADDLRALRARTDAAARPTGGSAQLEGLSLRQATTEDIPSAGAAVPRRVRLRRCGRAPARRRTLDAR